MSFDRLIDETASQLRSFVRDQELATWLTEDIAENALEIRVNDPKVLSRGRVEIGNELIVLEAVDASINAGIIPPYGRGVDGSEAFPHLRGSKVTVAPLFPRHAIARSLNDTIGAVGDQLYGIDNVDLRASTTRVSYELPYNTINVLSVSIPTDPNITRDRWLSREWDFDRQADWPSGKGLLLYDYPPVGRDFRVTIAVAPRQLFPGEDFSDSFLPMTCQDVIMFGAVSRLLATAQTYDIATRAVGSQTTLVGQEPAPQTAQNLAKHFYNLYQARLLEEQAKLNNRYNNRIHYQRPWG